MDDVLDKADTATSLNTTLRSTAYNQQQTLINLFHVPFIYLKRFCILLFFRLAYRQPFAFRQPHARGRCQHFFFFFFFGLHLFAFFFFAFLGHGHGGQKTFGIGGQAASSRGSSRSWWAQRRRLRDLAVISSSPSSMTQSQPCLAPSINTITAVTCRPVVQATSPPRRP